MKRKPEMYQQVSNSNLLLFVIVLPSYTYPMHLDYMIYWSIVVVEWRVKSLQRVLAFVEVNFNVKFAQQWKIFEV